MMQPPTRASDDETRLPTVGPVVRTFAVFGACGVLAWVFLAVTAWLKAHHVGYWAGMVAAAAYGASILGVVWLAFRRRWRAISSVAMRNYNRRFMILISVYVFALVGAIGAFTRLHPAGPLAWILAVAPALPVVGCVAVMGLYLREESDEFERTVMVHAALWALGGLLTFATVWGFLEMFGLVRHLEAWWAFPGWAVVFGLAQFIVRRRYQ